MNQTISSQRKAKISWNCRRGMLELDLILNRFINRCLDELTEEQFSVFETLLGYPDPDLYAWMMGYEDPASQELADFVAFIKRHDNL